MNLRQRLLVLLCFCTIFSLSQAQSLANLLPEETILALGMESLTEVSEQLEPFAAEFQRLELWQALQALSGENLDLQNDPEFQDFQDQFGDLDVFDFLGNEAWVAVSVSSFNPLPAVSMVTRLSSEAVPAVTSIISDAEAESPEGLSFLEEGSAVFAQREISDPESPIQVIAYARVDDVLLFSSNPDTMRGMLRRLAGSDEASLLSSLGYRQTLGQFDSAEFYGYFDLPKVVDVALPFAEPFTAGLDYEAAIDRVVAIFNTAGVSGGVMRLTDAGIETEGFQAVNAAGGDPMLYQLLTDTSVADRGTLVYTPADALGYTSSYTDLGAWWDYFNDVLSSVPDLQGEDLDSLLLGLLGIDIRPLFFDWAGSQVTTITTGVGETVEVGVPSENLLGEAVYLIESNDDATAEQGLDQFFQLLSGMLAMFGDPTGGMGAASSSTQMVGINEVTTYNILEGVSISYTVANGYAMIGTSEEGLLSVLNSQGNTMATSEVATLLNEAIPTGANSIAYSNSRATMEATAEQLRSQLEMSMGLMGSGDLDFDAVEAAADGLEQFLLFVAARMSNTYSYSLPSAEGIYSYGETDVNW